MRRVWLTLMLALLCAAVTAAQPPMPTTLLVVDDLHLDFRMTPRTRQLVAGAFQELLKANTRVAIISTSDHVPITGPTTESNVLDGAAKQVVGQALKPSEIFLPPQQSNAEMDHRAQKAFASTSRALASVAGNAAGGKVSVIYFSAGYLSGVVSPPEDLVASSLRLNAPVNTVDVFEIFAASSGNAGLDMTVHQLGPHQSLITLADRTHGTRVQTADEFEGLLTRITSAR
jgi:hypothetical protein